MTIPNVTVEFSPGEDPFDTAVWVDISSRALAFECKWGRDDELYSFDPSEAKVVLQNHDRLFDPEFTSGTYFGLLLPRVPFRIRSTASGGKDLFYGFVHGGWEQDYRPPKDARCTVTLIDLLGVIADEILPRSALEGEVLADSPGAYWHLDETTGTQMVDSSGNGLHGLYSNPLLGQDPLIVDTGGHSIQCVHVGDARGEYRGGSLPTAAPVTLEAWVKISRDLTQLRSILMVQRDSAVGSALWLQVTTSALGSPDGELVINFAGLGGLYKARGHTRVDDDFVHHVAMTMSSTAAANIKLYVDGVEQTKTLISGTTGGTWTGHLWWTVGNSTDTGQGDFGLGGLVDEAAVYPSALSSARILAHYEAGSSAFEGESSGDRIDRVLDIVGVPAGLRDIATGDTFMGPAIYQGRTAGEYLKEVAESEQGYLYVDHAAGGKIKFRGRYSRFTETRSQASQATFTDASTSAGLLHYERGGLRIDPNGIASIVNRVDINWPGGKETVTADDIGISSPYGPRIRTLSTQAPTPQAARSAGSWLITRYGQPQTRIRSIRTDSGASTAAQSPALDLRVGDRVTVVRTPQNTGNTITNILIVEGVEHQVSKGQDWETTYSFSQADTEDVWIWGTSEWDVDTVWG